MRKIVTSLATLVMAFALSGSAAAFSSSADARQNFPDFPPYLIVTADTSSCGRITVTATGYGLSTDSRVQIVAGQASTVVNVTRTTWGGGVPTATATFALTGDINPVTVRTRYGGFLSSVSQFGPGTPFVGSEQVWYRTAPCA